MEVIRQQEGPKSSVRLQVAAVSCDECGAIPWDELQVGHILTSFQLLIIFFFFVYFSNNSYFVLYINNFVVVTYLN